MIDFAMCILPHKELLILKFMKMQKIQNSGGKNFEEDQDWRIELEYYQTPRHCGVGVKTDAKTMEQNRKYRNRPTQIWPADTQRQFSEESIVFFNKGALKKSTYIR